jgi:3-oxoacyl-[acyl-carrier protein] reductase
MRLKDKVALVTGAGSGIGQAIAERFCEEGAFVYINDVNREAAEKVAAGLGDRARSTPADVSNSAQVKAMFEGVAGQHAGLDVLVNNAGIAEFTPQRTAQIFERSMAQMQQVMAGESITVHLDATLEMTDEDWSRMLAIHLNGTFYCTREALRRMRPGGSIVNVSSVAALMGLAGAPHYSAAKGGIIGFTRAVAQDVASRDIRVNAICPGWIDTPMTQPVHANAMVAMMIKNRTPLRRFGEPREIAATALFLASDDASFITGQWLSPNGGLFIG